MKICVRLRKWVAGHVRDGVRCLVRFRIKLWCWLELELVFRLKVSVTVRFWVTVL